MPITVQRMSISYPTHFIKYHLTKDSFKQKRKKNREEEERECLKYQKQTNREKEEIVIFKLVSGSQKLEHYIFFLQKLSNFTFLLSRNILENIDMLWLETTFQLSFLFLKICCSFVNFQFPNISSFLIKKTLLDCS